jgi:hypothetical protein
MRAKLLLLMVAATLTPIQAKDPMADLGFDLDWCEEVVNETNADEKIKIYPVCCLNFAVKILAKDYCKSLMLSKYSKGKLYCSF